MSKRRPYREYLTKTLANTTAEYVEGNEVPEGYLLYVTAGALEDENNAPTNIGFGFLRAGEFIGMEELETPSAGIRYHLDKTHVFRPAEKPAWRVEGGTLNDILRGYLEGYLEEFE